MEKQKAEKERKKLNKRLLKDTFISEFKNRKKVTFFEFIINFIGIFIALKLADLIVEILSINLWLMDMVITTMIIIVMLTISSIFATRIVKK